MTELPLQQPETKPEEKKKALAPWQNSLIKAETKFLAISNPERTKVELGFAAQLIENSAELRKCDPASIVNAVINVARTGITLNPVMKLAHLVARGGKCVLDFDYKGLVKVLKDNKCCKDIQAIIVYEDEEFEESNSQLIPHKHVKVYAKTEEEQSKRHFKGVYCQVLLMDNTVIYTQFLPYWEVLKAEKASPGAKSNFSPWRNWREDMVKKTKIRKDFKTLISGHPSEELTNAIKLEDENNGLREEYKGNKQSISDLFANAEEIEPEE